MKWVVVYLFCFLSTSGMTQLNKKDLIGTYYYQEIASGNRAKVDHANYYYNIQLKKDGSFLWTRKQGRLSVKYYYRYGLWTMNGDKVVLDVKLEAYDPQTYHSAKNGFTPTTPLDVLKNQKASGLYYMMTKIDSDSIKGLNYQDSFYQKVRN